MKIYYQIVFFIVLQFYRLRAKLVRTSRKPKNPNSVLYLAAFFPKNAGYHWRVEKWAEVLREANYNVSIEHVFEKEEFYSLYKKSPALFHIRYLRKRFQQVLRSRKYESVIVRRELLMFNDYGNLFLDKLLLKFHPNAILDFDDDLSAAKQQPKEVRSLYGKLMLENGDKFNDSLKLYKNFIVASDYLKGRIIEMNQDIHLKNILVVPTCVDYDIHPIKQYSEKKVLSLGWIGGEHNYPLLKTILPLIEKAADHFDIELIVIGGKQFKYDGDLKITFKPWSLKTEVEDLLSLDIGLMPLSDSVADKGKAGFKLIQYMGLGIVSIASSITVNKEIITDGVNGFLVSENMNWKDRISHVLLQRENFALIGLNARKTIEKKYTFKAHSDELIQFIRGI